MVAMAAAGASRTSRCRGWLRVGGVAKLWQVCGGGVTLQVKVAAQCCCDVQMRNREATDA